MCPRRYPPDVMFAPWCSIFLVEDHPVMRTGLEMFIRGQAGLELCGSAGSAEEALERLPGGADLVLVDVSLPGMSGLHLIREINDRWPDLRCLVLSGHAAERYAGAAQEAGAIDYVMKGDAGLLKEAIDRAAMTATEPENRPAPLPR